MDYEYFYDIISQYPILCIRLSSLSKGFELATIKGKCELGISKREIMENIIPGDKETRIYFLFGNGMFKHSSLSEFSNEKLRLSSQVTVSGIDVVFLCRPCSLESSQLKSSIPLIVNDIFSNTNELYIDVDTVYKIYNKRNQCINYNNDYAKVSTKQYFQNIYDKFNICEYIYILNIYLMKNALILNINVPDDYIKKININKEEYGQYVKDTYDTRVMLYKNINTYIDNL